MSYENRIGEFTEFSVFTGQVWELPCSGGSLHMLVLNSR